MVAGLGRPLVGGYGALEVIKADGWLWRVLRRPCTISRTLSLDMHCPEAETIVPALSVQNRHARRVGKERRAKVGRSYQSAVANNSA